MPAPVLDDDALDAIRELMSIGVGRAAAALSELMGQRIDLSIPSIQICHTDDCRCRLFGEFREAETVILQKFSGNIQGCASLCFPEASSLALARLLSGEMGTSTDGLDAELSGILLEVGNIVLNGVMGSLSNAMNSHLTYNLPELRTMDRHGTYVFQDALREDDVLIGNICFRVAQQPIEGSVVIVFAVGSLTNMLDSIHDAAAAV